MKNGHDEGNGRRNMGGGNQGKNKKIKMFLVATNVVASRPPERPPTGTPTARVNSCEQNLWTKVLDKSCGQKLWNKGCEEKVVKKSCRQKLQTKVVEGSEQNAVNKRH